MCNTHRALGVSKTATLPVPKPPKTPRTEDSLTHSTLPRVDTGAAHRENKPVVHTPSVQPHKVQESSAKPAPIKTEPPKRESHPAPTEGTSKPTLLLSPKAQAIQGILEKAAATETTEGKSWKKDRHESWKREVVSELAQQIYGSVLRAKDLTGPNWGRTLQEIRQAISNELGEAAKSTKRPEFLSQLPAPQPKVPVVQPAPIVKEKPTVAPSAPNPDAKTVVSSPPKPVAPIPSPSKPPTFTKVELRSDLAEIHIARAKTILDSAAREERDVSGKNRLSWQGDIVARLHNTLFGGNTPKTSEAIDSKTGIMEKVRNGLLSSSLAEGISSGAISTPSFSRLRTR